ncbi:MAG: hypothetical protein ACTHOB_09225 [Ginsengibacter sp.]
MKKGAVAVFLILLVIIVASFYPVTQNSTINIDATFDNTFLQVLHIDKWKNWYPEIKQAYTENPASYHISTDSSQKIDTISIPGKRIIVHAVTPMAYDVTETGDDSKSFAFTVFPGINAGKMKIFFERKVPLFTTLFQKNSGAENPLEGLKNYLETPLEFYGYNIKMAQIRDPTIASLVMKIQQKEIFSKMQMARQQLIKYLENNHLQKSGVISVSYIPLQRDSIQLTVGIPVDKIAPADKNIQCLSLPAKGRVLVADYTGLFSGRNKIYQAMTKYLTDHTLSIPAESFERYLNDSLPTSDSSEIKMELNYPVY